MCGHFFVYFIQHPEDELLEVKGHVFPHLSLSLSAVGGTWQGLRKSRMEVEKSVGKSLEEGDEDLVWGPGLATGTGTLGLRFLICKKEHWNDR